MRPSIDAIEIFLRDVDSSFPVSLSEKQDLHEFARKLYEKATLCVEMENELIISMVAGYTENVSDNKAYISIVATCVNEKGKGHATKLIKEFIAISIQKGLHAVHLYAIPSNKRAVDLYKRLGFEVLIIENEPRPNDLHLIYYIKK